MCCFSLLWWRVETGDLSSQQRYNHLNLPHHCIGDEMATTMASTSKDDAFFSTPLRSWMKTEEAKKGETITALEKDNNTTNQNEIICGDKESIIRRTTIAYGIAELLKCCTNGTLNEENVIRIDNFVIFLSKNEHSSRSWDDIKGVGMISSGLSLTIEEPSYLRGLLDGEEDCDGHMGRCLEVELTGAAGVNNDQPLAPGINAALAEESNRCQLLARLLYELFTHESFPNDALDVDAASTLIDLASTKQPAQKRARKSQDVSSRKTLMLSRAKGDFDGAEIPFQMPCIVRMQKQGIPASICLMVQNLLECALRGDGNGGQFHDAYESLGVVCADLHLLLLDPDRFLFDNQNQDTDDMKLLYRADKLYGRDKEETLITDAFCRVSKGKSEAFFIGGFSGSGKSMLVNSLRDTVKAVGGYTIKHKFDPMSREEPLSGVISAFNQVCRMIKDTDRPAIAKKLREEFGVDFSLLMRLLPSVSALFPELLIPEIRVEGGEAMNVRSVCFTLLRFVRVVSSPRYPIMLFLDDMQWADSTALDVIHTILSDTMGSCMFFVGTYRNNEVQIDHDIFDLMERLDISNVRTTKVSLTGLGERDLNTMISDALCLYPRICKPLSVIVFQKTKGNPFFVLEFMQSLKSRGLLQYNALQKRWVWNEDIIRSEDITDNVLHLLSTKMNGLSDDVQTLLKVMACFGSSTNESAIGYLSKSAEYAGVRNWLEGALHDGFIVKNGEGSLQFVHDKVREAAYNIIPESDKKQFHYHLGQLLYQFCGGNDDVGDTILLTASQINHGKEWIIKDKEMSIAIAELNMKAGKKALDGCDHKTAYSYFMFAVSLLPEDHWERHYDLSLRLNFLMAGAANSCCQYDEAVQLTRRGLSNARCFEDQLPLYLLLSQIFQAQGKVKDVYDTCSPVLVELGESIPESPVLSTSEMIRETLNMYEEVGTKWLEGEETNDKTLNTTLQFYRAIALASHFCKSHSTGVYFACKAVQLTLQRGLCKGAPLSLLQLTSAVMTDDNAVFCYRIAKNALSLQKRFDVAAQIPELYLIYYGRIAWRFEPLQEGIIHLRQGFEAGLSYGHVDMSLHCLLHTVKNALFSGANLKSTLKEIDYYLHLLKTYKSEMSNNFMLNFRETASQLIDNGEATSINQKAFFGDLDDPGNKLREAYFHHAALKCFWSGHTARCRHYSEKCMTLVGQGGQITSYIAKFFFGLNAVDLLRKKKHVKRSREILRVAITAIKEAAANSEWNFMNKLRLLEAEQKSLALAEHNWRKATDLYEASIEAAKKSGFIHEQGLACEKAAFYYKSKLGNTEKAIEYFKEARECYEGWGSRMKVDFIQKELDSLNLNNVE